MSSFSGGGDEPSAAEWVVTVVSVAVTLLLFGYVAWHAVTTPASADPVATVAGTEATDDGRLAATVSVDNPGSQGLESVTVAVDCANESLTFAHVPTDAERTGTVVCPAGTDDPEATVERWIPA
ncbi:hypothetical protein [Halomicrobium urmianum]|uniref:hypothetical protein n=1 Tax=Halomicrobium urmianum TaxID=1586233 RepID=UPI001CD9784A|nr:hypothetical protein [Halomicrobium urmianum]